jgi:hypothetical protein
MDVKKTQHFSENWETILYNIDFKPAKAVDPFAGNCDLVKYSPDTEWELYDIDVKKPEVNYRDSLLNPIDYTGKSVITNPPYLAKNKTKEFGEIFEKYQTDDLYKASILSIMGCENGILIIPLNFFTDEATRDVREKFFSQYHVDYVNYFTYQVFKNTTYNVCSFYFEKGKQDDDKLVVFNNGKTKNKTLINLRGEYGYRIAGEVFDFFKHTKPIFSRVIGNEPANTNIYVRCLDTRTKHFGLDYKPGYVYQGQKNDRIFATLKCEKDLSVEQQQKLVKEFNDFVESQRRFYGDLMFTNYRDNGRKRISLDDVYRICTSLLKIQ